MLGEKNDFSFVEQKEEIVSASLEGKIALAEEDVIENYCTLVNYALSYKNVKRRLSWSADKYYYKGKVLFAIKINGKTLNTYYALNIADYENTKMPVKDVSGKKSYELTPLSLKIKSGLSIKRAFALIDDVMKANGIEKGEVAPIVKPDDFVADIEKFIEEGKIRIK